MNITRTCIWTLTFAAIIAVVVYVTYLSSLTNTTNSEKELRITSLKLLNNSGMVEVVATVNQPRDEWEKPLPLGLYGTIYTYGQDPVHFGTTFVPDRDDNHKFRANITAHFHYAKTQYLLITCASMWNGSMWLLSDIMQYGSGISRDLYTHLDIKGNTFIVRANKSQTEHLMVDRLGFSGYIFEMGDAMTQGGVTSDLKDDGEYLAGQFYSQISSDYSILYTCFGYSSQTGQYYVGNATLKSFGNSPPILLSED